MLPKSYRVQESCAECAQCFVLSEQDEDTQYYCTHGPEKRPLCGSVHTDECIIGYLDKRGMSRESKEYTDEFCRLTDAWVSWSDTHQVVANGICNEYKPKG